MKFWRSGAFSSARESSPRDIGQATTTSVNSDGGPDSMYTGALEFNALEAPQTTVSSYAQTPAPAHMTSFRMFTLSSRRIAIAASVITFIVLIIAILTLLTVLRVGKKNTAQVTNGGSVTIDVASQDVTVSGQNAAITPPEISSKSGALLINGDIIGRGDLQLTNGSYVTVLKPTTLTSNQVILLPNASGSVCLDSNNCSFATQADLQATNAQLGQANAQLAQLRGQLGQIVVPATPIATTLNGVAGAVSIQGTSNQISVTTVNGVISLAAPQDIAPISSPTFAGLLLTGNFAVNGTVTLPFNCTGNLNGGALTTDGTGTIVCSDDDDSSGGGGAVTTPGGTAGTIPMFTAAQTIADSLISQAVGTVTISGNAIVTGSLSANALTLTTALSVPNGGTGATSFTANGVVIGNGAGALATTAAPAGGQVLLGNAGGVPTFTALTGDVAVTGAGVTTIQANSIALGVDTTGDYVQSLGALTGLSVVGNAGEGSTPALSVVYGSTANSAVEGNTTVTLTAGNGLTGGGVVTLGTGGSVSFTVAYGSAANTAVQGNVTLTCPAGAGNLTGGGNTITLGTGGSCNQISTVNNPTFSTSVTTASLNITGAGATGTLQVANLGQATTYTLPDPGSGTATICLSTGNCAGAGGGVTTSGGTTDRLSKFTGSNSIGDSVISDNGSVVAITGTANLVVQGGNATLGTLTQSGTLLISDGSSNAVSIVASGLAGDRTYTLPDAGGTADFCLSTGNCVGGAGGGAPNVAAYLVASLDGTLTNERALVAGSNISITDGGANANMTVATVQNPTFTTSVTTPLLQSSNALTITSAAGNIIAVDAGTTIELQDSTNVTGDLDASGTFTAGTGNAFQINSSGAISAATGITSSGTIRFSGYNCTANANGGKLTTDGSGNLTCADDNGGAGSAISGSGTNGTIPLFNGAQTITDSIITQSGSTITITGDLSLTTDLTVANGGTGASTFTSNGVLFGNGAGVIQATAAGTSGQVLVANASGVPTFVSFSNDVTVSDTGVVTIANDAVTSAKIANGTVTGTDIANATVANSNLVNDSVTVTAGNGLGGGGAVALGGSTTLNVQYGSAANTAVQGNTSISITAGTGLTGGGSITLGAGGSATLDVTYGSALGTAVQGSVQLTCPAGAGNLSGGGGTITLGTGGSCGNLSIVNNPTFTTSVTTPSIIFTGAGSNGTVQIANLGQATVFTLPDPGAGTATICLSTGNCAAAGAAGGDLTGSYPNPTIAKLQGSDLDIATPTAGHVLIYNGTNSAWENHALSSDITISETGVATIANDAVTSAKIANGTITGTDIANATVANSNLINSSLTVTAGNGLSGGGAASLGGSTSLAVAYGSAANTAVQGNTGITVTAGSNLTGGGGITLGAGGTVTLDVTSSPNFSGTLTAQGATITVGGNAQQGSLVLNDGSANTGTVQTAALGQNTTYTLPDPGAGTATICLSTGNCAGAGGGVTTVGGTTNQLSKFTGSNSIGDSSISDDGSVVTVTGTANLVVQGGNATVGTLTQAGTIAISDGSSNTVSIVAAGLAADRTYTLPDAGGPADFCLSTGNCVGGAGGGAPNAAAYLVASLDGTLTNERALAQGDNITVTDGGANGNMTVATVQNPAFTTSVTTPLLQSSNALVITSAAGNTIAVNAGTTIELQDSTNVTGDLDASGAFTAGGSNAFQINSSGAITAVTGITSSGTIRFSGYNCTVNANGGKLTTDGSGNLTCADDNGGAGSAISGSGTNGTIPLFNGAQTITDSIITQSGSTITITGDLLLTTDLTVANGGTGASTFTSNGVLYGNGAGAIQATAAGTGGQVLVANASGVPTFVSFSNDVTVTDTGAVTIANDAVTSAKIDDGTITGTDIANATVANSNLVNSSLTVTAGNGLTGGGAASLGGSTSLAVAYGSAANTAVQGNTTLTITAGTGLTGGGSVTLGAGGSATLDVTYGSALGTAVQGSVQLTCPSGTGNLSGGGTTITLGTGGSCGNLSIVNNPTFTTSVTTPSLIFTGAGSNGTVQIANLGQATAYTIPDPGAGTATFCLSSGNCAAAGSAGGDLTGNYPNPTIAKLQGGDLDIVTPTAGHVLIYNGTNSAWENHGISSDVTISETGVATIANDAVTSAKIANGTVTGTDIANATVANGNLVNSSLTVTAGTGLTGGGAASLGGSTSLSVSYGSSAGTAVEGSTSISVTN